MKTMGTLVYRRKVAHFFDLLRELVDRDMKLLYKRSALGIAWTLINPLLQLAVFSFVFRSVIPIDIPKYHFVCFQRFINLDLDSNCLISSNGTNY